MESGGCLFLSRLTTVCTVRCGYIVGGGKSARGIRVFRGRIPGHPKTDFLKTARRGSEAARWDPKNSQIQKIYPNGVRKSSISMESVKILRS